MLLIASLRSGHKLGTYRSTEKNTTSVQTTKLLNSDSQSEGLESLT